MASGGYFSEFKTIFLVTLLAALMGGLRLSLAGILSISTLAGATLFLGVVWTSIKVDYRNYLSAVAPAQTLTYEARISRLGELAGSLTVSDLEAGFEKMIRRLGYTELFGAVLAYVPETVPHEDGAILGDAILRPLMPRLLFPSKSAIDDSERTNTFTGLSVSGAEQGTSISLGWIAEFYIDFGAYLMMAVVLAYGAFLGSIKRLFENWHYSRGVLGSAVSMSILLGALYLESSITKVFGGLVASMLAAGIVLRFVAPRWLAWLRP